MTPFQAAISGDLNWFQQQEDFEKLSKILCNELDSEKTPIELLIENGHIEILKYLFEETSQCNFFKKYFHENNLLLVAVDSSPFSVVDYFTQLALQFSVEDSRNLISSASIEAGRCGQLEVLQYFFSEVDLENQFEVLDDFNWILWSAITNGHLEVSKYLLDECPSKQFFDLTFLQQDAFEKAIQNSDLKMVQYLLEESSQQTVLCFPPEELFSFRISLTQSSQEVKGYFQPILALKEAIGTENWCLYQGLGRNLLKTQGIEFLQGVKILNQMPESMLMQLFASDEWEQLLTDYILSQCKSAVIVTSKRQLHQSI